MKKTIWKDISGYEGLYQISSDGDVMSLRKKKIMKPFDNNGYLRIGLSKDGKRKNYLIHRLVAKAFLVKGVDENEINHIDLNKKNNSYKNLEWVTGSQNVRHAVKEIEGRKAHLKEKMSDIGIKYNHLGVEASKKPVKQIDKDNNRVIAVFESAREASRRTGSNYRNISQVCNGDKKTHNGYKWEFV